MKNFFLLLALILFSSNFAKANSFKPSSDDFVIEVVDNANKSKKLKDLLNKLKSNPNDANLAEFTARQFIILGHQESDPRFYSYAEAALEPWWTNKNPANNPKEIQILIANIKQFRHNFKDALNDLDLLLKNHPDFTPAILMRSAIYMTLGEYQKALKDCDLISNRDLTNKTNCEAYAMSMGANIELAFEKLKTTIKNKAINNKDQNLWSLGILAEIASRLGLDEDASLFYQTALKANPSNTFLLSSYADFLLHKRNFPQVLDLLSSKTKSDPLLLRLTIAEKNLKLSEFKMHQQELGNRFKEARLRNDGKINIHEREESMFNLFIVENYDKALQLAKSNFASQKEITDIRLLVEAAYMANDPEAKKSITNFIQRNAIKDRVIDEIIKVNK